MSRSWLVTGASRGIGAAIAREAGARGDRVALVARSDAVERQAELLRAGGIDAHALRADLTEPDAVRAVIEEAREALGGLDVVVNNAAIHRGGRIERLSEEDFEAVVAADLVAPFRVAKAAAVHLGDGGAIVNIGAVVGMRGFPGDAAYGAAKAGLAGLTKVLAVELARRRITVNLVIPGFTETEMTTAVDERARQKILDRIPLGRACRADEVAQTVAWVAASPYMTGAIVPVDGGLMAALGGR